VTGLSMTVPELIRRMTSPTIRFGV
jgi:hypothetical protein